jgi:5-methylcytosine-specific restriction enzyme A
MPVRPALPCRHPGCPALVQGGGYCPSHKRPPRAKRERGPDKPRGTTAERGYGADWRRVRAAYLASVRGRCERCGQDADTVHHKLEVERYPELRLDPYNLEAVCKRCHNEIHGRR